MVERAAMIQQILFPVDFSASCAALAPLVRREADIFSAKVTLLHVVEPATSGFDLLVRPVREIEEDREHAARARLNSFLKTEFPDNESRRLLLKGDPATRIAEAARERGFDLIVMPTYAGAFRRRLIGSTTAKVLNDADCPVLTTQHAETISPRPLEHREWLCAVGLQADSERVLRYASQIAKEVHANLTLVHAIPTLERDLPIQLDLDERLQSAEKEAADRRISELQRAVGSKGRVAVAIGPIRDTLVEAASRLRADVLMIGRSPQPGSMGRIRDLTYAMVRDAPCPVLSI
jgi:nucleotide-binding universal stress UspA family protein